MTSDPCNNPFERLDSEAIFDWSGALYRTITLLVAVVGLGQVLAAEPTLRQPTAEVYALTGVRIVVSPGNEIESGSLVVRDGIIEAVGQDIDIPADAAVFEYDPEEADTRVYPGLIDAYVPVEFGRPGDDEEDEAEDGQEGDQPTYRPGQYPHPLVMPGRRMSSHHWPGERVEALRNAGFTTAVLAPDDGLVRGHSALVNLGDGGYGANVLDPELFQHVSLQARISGRQFPNSLMGAMALLRQAFMDAQWQAEAREVWQRNPAQERPEFLEGIEPLEAVLSGDRDLVIDAADMLDSLRAASIAAEFELQPWLVGHGEEYQRLDRLVETGLGQILPLDFPAAPDVDEEKARDVGLQELRHWHLAPENPERVVDTDLEVLMTTHPHSSPANLFENLEQAIERGLDPDRALAALTTQPAEALGIGDRAGRLEPGYIANFIVVEDDLFVASPALREVWVDGRLYKLRELEPPEVEPAGTWELALLAPGMGTIDAELDLKGEASSLSGTFEIMGTSIPLSEARVSGSRLDLRIDGSRLGLPGAITMYLDIEEDRGRGNGTSPQGDFKVSGRRTDDPDEEDAA